MVHRHEDEERPMRHLDDERIDGLRVREYTCDCGYIAAVLTRVRDEVPSERWPFSLQAPRTAS